MAVCRALSCQGFLTEACEAVLLQPDDHPEHLDHVVVKGTLQTSKLKYDWIERHTAITGAVFSASTALHWIAIYSTSKCKLVQQGLHHLCLNVEVRGSAVSCSPVCTPQLTSCTRFAHGKEALTRLLLLANMSVSKTKLFCPC